MCNQTPSIIKPIKFYFIDFPYNEVSTLITWGLNNHSDCSRQSGFNRDWKTFFTFANPCYIRWPIKSNTHQTLMDCASVNTQQKLTEARNQAKNMCFPWIFQQNYYLWENSPSSSNNKTTDDKIFFINFFFPIFHLSSIALGNGPDGYRATFNNIAAYGVSNLTVSNVRSDIETLQFQLTFEIPRIRTRAKYRSTGVLILIETSGSGDYWGDYGVYFL